MKVEWTGVQQTEKELVEQSMNARFPAILWVLNGISLALFFVTSYGGILGLISIPNKLLYIIASALLVSILFGACAFVATRKKLDRTAIVLPVYFVCRIS